MDRFHAIFRPISYASGSNCITNLLIMMAWVMSLCVALPMFINYPGFSNWDFIVHHLNTSKTSSHSLGKVKKWKLLGTYSHIYDYYLFSYESYLLHSSL